MALKGPRWPCFLDWFGVVMCGSGSQGAPFILKILTPFDSHHPAMLGDGDTKGQDS